MSETQDHTGGSSLEKRYRLHGQIAGGGLGAVKAAGRT